MHCVNVYAKPALLASVTIYNFCFKFENASVSSFSYFPLNIWNASAQELAQKILALLINFVNSYMVVAILPKFYRNQR